MQLRDHAGSIKLWLYAAVSVILTAWISPLVFNAGQALVEVSSGKPTNGPLEHLAALCKAMEFHESFVPTLAGCALLLLPPLIDWIRPAAGANPPPWPLHPLADTGDAAGRGRLHGLRGPWQALTGASITAGLLVSTGLLWIATGWLAIAPTASGLIRALPGILATAILAATAMEGFFRHLALGMFLRSMRPSAAIAMSSVFFAAVLATLPNETPASIDPEGPWAGFAMLKHQLACLCTPSGFCTSLVPPLALGALLAHIRWRTASLWMPVGVHAGWLAGTLVLQRVSTPTPGTAAHLATHCASPLAAILLAFLIIHRITRHRHEPHPTAP